MKSVHIMIWALLLPFISFCQKKKAATQPPNIVLIFMDDMGYGDPVCYGGGPYQTPNIDALAASGIRFTNFYAAQAVCTASRSAIMTGCYPTRISMHGAIDNHAKFALNGDEETMAEILKARGYKTGMVGKWHLGHKEPFLPLQNGFDEYLGLPYSNDMWAYDYNGERWKDTSFWRAKYAPLPLIDGNKTVKIIASFADQDQLTTQYTERAVSFIKKNKNNPFFLYFAHSMMHVPLGVSDKFKGKSGAGMFGDVIEEVDWSVGQVMKTLKDNGLAENTIVIFTSDNGPWLNFGNHAGNTSGLREGKGTAWDGGVKVPGIISWPAHAKAGVVSNKLLTTMDLLPTLAEICGAKQPVKKIDGVSFKDLLLGDMNSTPRNEFAYYYDRNNLKAIRKGQWKLVFPAKSRTYGPPSTIENDRYPGKTYEVEVPLALYNLSTDPGEDRDVKDHHPEIVKELDATAQKYREQLGDGLTNTIGKEVRPAGKL
ncbi:sulfatase [Niabella insulamsoli]|uniref:sulfatase family protein n=1 Tax=Niabella insulamsoli TaxID=3144874 RepID=UPI0031FC37FE